MRRQTGPPSKRFSSWAPALPRLGPPRSSEHVFDAFDAPDAGRVKVNRDGSTDVPAHDLCGCLGADWYY